MNVYRTRCLGLGRQTFIRYRFPGLVGSVQCLQRNLKQGQPFRTARPAWDYFTPKLFRPL
jgi:hypothetical protein